MKNIPNLSLRQVYPRAVAGFNLNTCHDPDCGNFGVGADFLLRQMAGVAPANAGIGSNSGAVGLGRYKLDGTRGEKYRRVSTVFEYRRHPRKWLDRKILECQHHGGSRPCGTHFELQSNEHLVDEIERLRGCNDVFHGPACRACGRDYLEAPDEFILDGAELGGAARRAFGKSKKSGSGHDADAAAGPDRVRLIHKPCRGRPGSRISATLDHRRQRRTSDNVAILMALVNGNGITKVMRMMAPSGSGRSCGAKRVYDRIFWLERTLLAFEKAQLARWKAEREASGEPIRHHLAHDDIVLSVNWETSQDRRLTQLLCSATADVRSGYVYRLDVDFDPTVDPVSLIEDSYVAPSGAAKNLRKAYKQASGFGFTAPLMAFQRPTGRFEEEHLFGAAAHRLILFREEMIEGMPGSTPAQQAAKHEAIAEIDQRIAMIQTLHGGYFNLHPSERDNRMPFSGIMTKHAYTKAAHFAVLREQLPAGEFRLITEQEAVLPNILPHVFRQEIQDDRFRWIAMTFDKEVKKPEMQTRVAKYKTDFESFLQDLRTADPVAEAVMSNGQRLRAYVADRMKPAILHDRFGNAYPAQSDNYKQAFMPMLWIASPLQTAGETNKIVGFPLMRAARRQELKSLRFDQDISDPETRAAMAYHVWSATLQPVSTFFNALRERLSFARRAGGRSARSGPSYVNGAAFNPRVLIAVLNIFRVYYNWFEPRQYVAPWLEGGGMAEAPQGEILKRVPGTEKVVALAKRQKSRPVFRTPAMRLGVQEVKHDKSSRLIVPSLHRVLYRPWLYWGTPVWDKFENRKVDRRSLRYMDRRRA